MTLIDRRIIMTSTLRPNLLVRIRVPGLYESEVFSYVGEVMSFPFAGSVKARRIPGHPGTLEDVNIVRLSPLLPHQKYKWVQYAEVKDEVLAAGLGSFPIDMLRRENAAPVNFALPQDEDGFGRPQIDMGMGFDNLVVARCTTKKNLEWNSERWRSFGWSVRPIKTETLSAR